MRARRSHAALLASAVGRPRSKCVNPLNTSMALTLLEGSPSRHIVLICKIPSFERYGTEIV